MNRRLTIGACTVALAAATVVPGVATIGHATPTRTAGPRPIQTLLNSVPRLVRDAVDLGSINPLQTLHVVVPLAIPDQPSLERFVTSEYTKGSANFHQFIDPVTFGARYGAPAQRTGLVVRTLRRLGLTVSPPSSNRLFVKAAGPAGLLEKVFGTTIHNFGLGNGLHFFSNVANIKLPDALVGAVTGVIGLDDSARPYPALRAAAASPSAAPRAVPALATIGQNGGATPCPAAIAGGGYTAPQLAQAYNFNGLYAKHFLGQGMTAALVEFDDFHDSNIRGFESCYGLHIPVHRHVVDGGTGGQPRAGEVEDMADIGTILQMLPKLKRLDVYVAPITNLGEIDLYNRFAMDHSAPVLSSSWGNCEELESAADNRLFSLITEQAAAQGQQIFQASGDSGAVDCRGFPEPTLGSISAMQEAGVPWVTGVGGTDLGQATANGLSPTRHEATWNDDGAGGGGVSTMWPMPAWQAALKSARTAPGHSGRVCGAAKGGLCREIPDISANADSGLGLQSGKTQFTDDVGSAGYSVYCATANCTLTSELGLPLPPLPIGVGGAGNWQPIGGTSLAAPLVASAAVLWDQQARRAHLTGYGLLNPSLYADARNPKRYARDFHDITTDSNSDQYDTADCPAGCNPRHLYRARKGYDMATGLGSIDAAALGADLVRQAKRVELSNDRVHVYGYRGGVATSAPVIASTGLRKASYSAHSNAKWLHVRSGKAPGRLRWSASPTGLSIGTRTGTVTIVSRGHRAKLTVVYAVSRRAKLHVSSPHLVFREGALDSSGKPTAAQCGATLWNDELFDAVNFSSGTKVSKRSKQVLKISNRGPKGSVLHWQAFPYSFTGAWLGVDLTHGKTQTSQSRPLVPTDGSDRTGRTSRLRLASTANVNALGGYPTMNRGTYHGVIEIRDLADPRHVHTVTATLILGNGRKTPTIHAVAPKRVTVKHGGTTTINVKLSDASHSCGFDYSLSSNEKWATANADNYSGTVAPHGSGSVGGSDTGAGTGTITVGISAKHLAAGVHRLTLTVQSQDAEGNPTLIHLKVRVRK